MHLLLILLIVLLVVGVLPRWPYSTGWGYGPSSIVGVLLVIFVVWLLFFGGLRRF